MVQGRSSDRGAPPAAAGGRPARTVPRGYTPADAALLLALAGMWGLSFLFIEIALRGSGPFWIVAARTGTGALVLLGILALRGRRLPASIGMWGHLLVLGLFANALPWMAAAWGQQWLPSGLVALLMAAVPTSTLLVSAAARLERLTAPRFAGLALALAGVGLTVAMEAAEPGRILAIAAVIAATLMYALGAVYASLWVSGREGALTIATGQIIMAFAVALPAALLLESTPSVEALTAPVVGSLLALGAIGTGAAFVVFYSLIERVGATNTTLVTYLIPLVAVVAGTLVLGERLAPLTLAGGGLIIAGVWLAQKGTSTSG
jgi:drug/metabolite transporter (DMT)-like permease